VQRAAKPLYQCAEQEHEQVLASVSLLLPRANPASAALPA